MHSQGSPHPQLPSATQAAVRTAAQYAADADTGRSLHPEVVDAILDAGFARHFVPHRWGGDAGTVTDLLRSVAALGESCTSAAWCASVMAGAARMGAYLPEAGQKELWAKGADTKVVGALMPRGTAEAVAGGWRLSGAWEFTSGVTFSDWALICALAPAGEHREAWFFAVPRADYQVRDTWFSVGMRGTASSTLVVEEAFVAEHRAFMRSDMMAGRSVGSPARCHTAPLRLLSGLLFAAPALGAARAALASWSERTAARSEAGGTRTFALRDLHIAARAAGETDAAALLLERAAAVADLPRATAREAVRNPADCALAVDRLVGVVEELFRAAGSQGQLDSEPVQRIWRDIHCLASHIALRWETAADSYGSQLLTSAAEEIPDRIEPAEKAGQL